MECSYHDIESNIDEAIEKWAVAEGPKNTELAREFDILRGVSGEGFGAGELGY